MSTTNNTNTNAELSSEEEVEPKRTDAICFYEEPPVSGVSSITSYTRLMADGKSSLMYATVNFPTIKTRDGMRAEGKSWEDLHQYYLDTWGVEILMQLAERALIVNVQDQMRACIKRDSLAEIMALGNNFVPLRKKVIKDADTAIRVLRDNINNVSDELSGDLLKMMLSKKLEAGAITKEQYDQMLASMQLA